MAENRYSVLVPIAGAVLVVVTAADEKTAADEAFERVKKMVARVSVPAPDCGLGSLEELDAYEQFHDGLFFRVPIRSIEVKKLPEGE